MKGQHPPGMPMLPRVMLRDCEVEGKDCLDVGTMEALVPTLLARRRAKRVLAVDAVDHCVEKMERVRRAYGVDFDYRSVGLLYGLDEKLEGQSFDLINLSGVLYHVFSPLQILCGIRPLLKRNGLLVVSTNVVD